MTNSTESLYLMRQAFFPASVTHFLETERANVVRIRVCWVPNKMRPPLPCNSLDSNNQIAKLRHTAGTFAVQSTLPVLNMIAVDQLPAFDPMLTGVVHSKFIDHSYTSSKISSFISDLFPCTPSEDNLTQGTPPPNLYSMHYLPSFAFLSSLGDTSKLFFMSL